MYFHELEWFNFSSCFYLVCATGVIYSRTKLYLHTKLYHDYHALFYLFGTFNLLTSNTIALCSNTFLSVMQTNLGKKYCNKNSYQLWGLLPRIILRKLECSNVCRYLWSNTKSLLRFDNGVCVRKLPPNLPVEEIFLPSFSREAKKTRKTPVLVYIRVVFHFFQKK